MAGGGLPPPTEAKDAVVYDGPIPPFPLGRAMILAIAVINESLCANMLLPFIGLFVAHLQGTTAEEAGFASGFLVAVFQLGQVFTGKKWGHLSDLYGRKPALQGGLIFSGIIMLLFGISPNIYMSVFLRFAHGLANGNVLVAKAMIPEVMGHKAHEAKGYTIPSLTWCLGTLIGPAIGGALYDPTRYSWFPYGPESMFGTNPALLPSLVIASYSFFALFVCTFFLEETNKNAKPLPWARKAEPPAITSPETASSTDSPAQGIVVATNNNTTPAVPKGHHPKTKFGYKQAFQMPLSRFVLIIYMIISFADIAFFEILPLWAVAGRSFGGLALPSQTVGLVILINGLPGVCANLLFSTAINKLGGPVPLMRVGVTVWATANCLLPFVHNFEDPITSLVVLSAILIVRVMGAAWTFSSCFLLIGRSAPPGHLGSINGIGQSVGCMTRTLAPIIVAPIFAWSIQEPHPFPFNYHFAFIIGWVPVLAVIPLTAKIARDPAVLGLPVVKPADGAVVEFDAPTKDDLGGEYCDEEEYTDGVLNSTFTTSLQQMQYEDLHRLSNHKDAGELVGIVVRSRGNSRLPTPAPASLAGSIAGVPAHMARPPRTPAIGSTPTLGSSAPRRMVLLGASPALGPEMVLMESASEKPTELSI